MACLVLALLPACAHAQWRAQLEGALAYDDNVGRAQVSADKARDAYAAVAARLSRGFDLDERSDATLGLDAGGQAYRRYDGLDFAAFGAHAAYRRKLGLGRFVPTLEAHAALVREDAREDLRDADRAAFSLAASRRLTEELVAGVGVAYDRRAQRDDRPVVPGVSGRPFDLQGRTLFARASYAFGMRCALVGELSLRRGDVAATTRRNLRIFEHSNAIALDPAIGPEFVAYRISGATTQAVTAGVSRELGRNLSFDAALAFERTRTDGGLAYDRSLVSFYLTYQAW